MSTMTDIPPNPPIGKDDEDLEIEELLHSLEVRRSRRSRRGGRRAGGGSGGSSVSSVSSIKTVGSSNSVKTVSSNSSAKTVGAGRRLSSIAKKKKAAPSPTMAGPVLRRTATTSEVPNLEAQAQQKMIKRRMRRAISHNHYEQPPAAAAAKSSDQTTTSAVAKPQAPDVCLLLILGGAASLFNKTDTQSSLMMVGVTQERIQANSSKISQAIRDGDLHVLLQHYAMGASLDGCTSHGESTVHLAARLGQLDILQFLVQQGGVSLRVTDDNGRTPLHDACWSSPPHFDLVRFLIGEAPDLLFVLDHRGYTAFQYIPQTCWVEWGHFLRSNADFLRESVNSDNNNSNHDDQSQHHDDNAHRAQEQLSDAQKRLRALMQKASQFGIGLDGSVPAAAPPQGNIAGATSA